MIFMFYFIFFSIDLMKELVYSPSLFVMQVEMDVYSTLKKVFSVLKKGLTVHMIYKFGYKTY